MKRILFIGGYGYKDLGDEAHLTAVLANFRKLLPDAKFVVLSDNMIDSRNYFKEETEYSLGYYLSQPLLSKSKSQDLNGTTTKKHGILDQVKRVLTLSSINPKFMGYALLLLFNAKRVKNNKKTILLPSDLKHFLGVLRRSDLLFNVGGGNITSVWRPVMQCKFLTYLLCRLMEKPVILSGQTIGPFFGRVDKFFARCSLNQVNLITLRGKFSVENLRSIGVTEPLIMLTADDATTLASADPKTVGEIFSEEKIDCSHHPFVGLNVNGLSYLAKSPYSEKAKQLMAKIADYLVVKHNATVLFVRTQYGVDDDSVPILETIQMMEHKDSAFTISDEHDEKTVKGIISQLDLAVGFRYHFIVFAVTSGVPAVGLYFDDYYSIKMKGAYRFNRSPQQCF